jgi:hypothetical protein
MSNRVLFFAIHALIGIVVQAQCPWSQTLPPGVDNQPVSGGSSIFQTPVGGSGVLQWVYGPTMFQHQTPITIGEIWVRNDGSNGLSAFSFPAMEVVLASAAVPIGQLSSSMPANLSPDATVVRPLSPWTGGPVSAGGSPSSRFVPLGLTVPFVFNPSAGSALVVQVRVCGVTTPWTGGIGVFGQNAQAAEVSLAGTCAPGAGAQVMPSQSKLLKIDYFEGDTQWQTNSPASTLGAVGFPDAGPCGPIEIDAGVGYQTLFNLGSTSVGLGWDLGVMLAPAVPKSPATTTPGGQIVHLDIQHPTFGSLFNFGNLTNPAVPFQPMNVPFVPVAAFQVLTAQMVNVTPASADGFVLSAPIQLTVRPPVQNLGFTTDDQFKTLSLSTLAPVNAITGVPFFNAVWSEIQVSANGRLMFGAGSTSYYPDAATWATDPASVGYFSDFSPQAPGASVTAAASGSLVTINYNNVPHWASTTPTNFAISIDAVTGVVTISGIASIVPVSGYDAVVGISAGLIGGGINAGPTVFSLGGPNPAPPGPPGSVPAIYEFGANGLLAPGVNGIMFIPTGSNYSWIAF